VSAGVVCGCSLSLEIIPLSSSPSCPPSWDGMLLVSSDLLSCSAQSLRPLGHDSASCVSTIGNHLSPRPVRDQVNQAQHLHELAIAPSDISTSHPRNHIPRLNRSRVRYRSRLCSQTTCSTSRTSWPKPCGHRDFRWSAETMCR
jgi:hypothetical protein